MIFPAEFGLLSGLSRVVVLTSGSTHCPAHATSADVVHDSAPPAAACSASPVPGTEAGSRGAIRSARFMKPVVPEPRSVARPLATLVVGLAASGCAVSTIRTLYAGEYDCPKNEIRVVQDGTTRFTATGCGETTAYLCTGTSCLKEQLEEEEPEVVLLVPVVPTASAAEQPEALQQVATREESGGVTKVSLDLQLDPSTKLRLRAAPEKHGQLVQVKLLSTRNIRDCELKWMVNGQLVLSPKERKDYDAGTREHIALVDVSRDLVRELAAARQFALRACDQRWTISPEQLDEVRHFVALYEEELAWAGEATGGSGGLLAPSGGWPSWTVRGTPPEPVAGTPLDAEPLFEMLSRSVLQVEALGLTGTARGSAVAISATEMLTNCHVVEGAQKIIARHGKREWVARISRASPAQDRCVLELDEAVLTPVRGVRRFSDVRVGEKVYTLGAPSGLELTLADGIVSGLRDQDGLQLIQTTAPISPGSSGGGLFDTHGNVLGVTTAVLVGRERLNQALNFALPASSFWDR